MAHVMDLPLRISRQPCDHGIRKLHPFCFLQSLGVQRLILKLLLHLYQNGDLINKPQVDLRRLMDGLVADPLTDSLRNLPDPAVVYHLKLFQQIFSLQMGEIIRHQAVHMLLQGTDSLHERPFKIIADTHNLAGSLHLSSQRPFCADKFIKRKPRNFHHAVIQHRLEACISLLCHCVFNLIQRISQGDLCRHLGDGVARGLGSQRRRPADPGVDLNDTILKGLRMEGILYIAPASNIQLADNIQRRGTEHLILLIAQCLGGSHHNTVSRMYAYRINVFHVTYGDTVALAVPHHLIFDFLPSCNAPFHQHLPYPGKPEAVFQDLDHLSPVMSDSSAAAAKRIGRTQNHRITDLFRKPKSVFHIFHYQRRRTGLSDLLHRSLELQPVFRLLDGLGCGSDQPYIIAFQKSALFQLHGQIKRSLSPQRREHTVRTFLQDQLLYYLCRQRLNVDPIRYILVRHNGRRVGI